MALGLTFEQSNNGKTLTITEASTESPSLAGATITISTVVGTTVTQVYSSVMSAEWIAGTETELELEADDLGGTSGDAIIDGVYRIKYVTTADTTGVTYNTLLDYNVKYCVYNMFRQLPDKYLASPALCTNKEVERVRFMGTMLKSLEYAAACGQVNEIQTILATLQNLCLNPGINECYCN